MADYLLLMDQLKGEYKEAFDKVYIYTNIKNMEGKTEQDMMMSLLDMMLTAQSKGKPVEKIIGNDIEKFCKNYFEEYNYKVRLKEQVPLYLNRVMWFVLIYGLLCLCFCIGEEDFQLFKETMDVAGYVIGMACGFGILVLSNICVKPFIFKCKKMSATVYDTIVLLVLFVAVISSCIMVGDRELNIPLFPMIIISLAYILIYKAVCAMERYKKYGTIWKRKEPFRETWLENVKEEIGRELPEELVKRYHKINKKRIHRGKEPMTPEQYMKKLHKENKQSDIASIAAIVLIGAMVVSMSIDSMINESILDGIILAVILLIIEIPICVGMLKMTKKRKNILAECGKHNITVIEYAEILKNK